MRRTRREGGTCKNNQENAVENKEETRFGDFGKKILCVALNECKHFTFLK